MCIVQIESSSYMPYTYIYFLYVYISYIVICVSFDLLVSRSCRSVVGQGAACNGLLAVPG